MGGLLLLLGFEAAGCVLAEALFRRRSMLIRLWLGLTAGLLMMLWFPSLFAYAFGFTQIAQFAALGLAIVCALLARLWLSEDRAAPGPFCGDMPRWLAPALVLPLLALSAYLQYTHNVRDVGGALHVGQSTNGDLPLHLGIATGLIGSAYPPGYTLIQGALLGYPFLMDALSASMLCVGSSLQLAFVLPGTLMMGLVFLGFVILSWELTRSRAAVVLSFLLMFLNGGLGFFYVLDGVFQDSTALREVFVGFYKAPANMVEHNIRWVNVICDMMVPQRTLLAGWALVIPALYLLIRAMREGSRRLFIMLGVLAGAMPMVHTHSFLALALISAGCLLYTLRHGEDRAAILKNYGIYAAIAAALALPQLLTWSVPQTVGGGSLAFRFNWVNFDASRGSLIDGYFWFWIKNVGPVYLLMVPAALSQKKLGRALSLGALLVYIVAELIQFQPNEYDNNKLFYVAFLLMLPMVSGYLVSIYSCSTACAGGRCWRRRFLCSRFPPARCRLRARRFPIISSSPPRRWRPRPSCARNCRKTPSFSPAASTTTSSARWPAARSSAARRAISTSTASTPPAPRWTRRRCWPRPPIPPRCLNATASTLW